MNAIFYKISTPSERGTIDTICSSLAHRDFDNAEDVLIDYLSDVMSREYNTSDDVEAALADLRTFYIRFNNYYLNWTKENGIDADKELVELQNDLHDNLLFAHMTDPESMDDLVYAVANYLTNIEDEGEQQEADYQLDCYIHQISH